MIEITVAAPVPSPPGTPVTFAWHTFRRADDGQLEHLLDGRLWATVPPEGMRDYARTWPQCQDLVDQLLRPSPASSALEATDPGLADPPL
jgi:hypothetical protein